MNKETIYIEPSDDITDVLTKLKNSDKKVVAIVPPKKPTVFLSSVNIKLIARTAKSEKKAVVLVSTDDSLIKLAMAANLPVASSLKSRPVLPGEAAKAEEAKEKEAAEDEEADSNEEEPESEAEDEPEESDEEDDGEDEDEDEDSDDDEEDDDDEGDEEDDEEEADKDDIKNDSDKKETEKPAKKQKKEKKKKEKKESASGFKGWLIDHKAWVIFGSLAVIAIGAFLFWAFTIAPKVKVKISVRTTSANFSESVKFSTQPADEDSDTGVFYLREEKLEKDQTVKFTATGKKDVGESATGQVTLTAYFLTPGSVTVPAGSKFTHGGFDYTTTEAVTITGPADMSAEDYEAVCSNWSKSFKFNKDYCQVSAAATVVAAAPGEDYNLSATNEGWSSSVTGITVSGRTDITGGTSRIITTVQQSDIDLALDKMKSGDDSENGKNELYGKLSESVYPVDASYEVNAIEPKSTPAVGEEVKEGVTPQLFSKTTYKILTIDRVRLEEFIQKKAHVEEGKRFYSVGDYFLEYFAKGSEGNYSAKLKTTYKVGPEISETEVLEKIRGEKIGRIEPILKDSFSGVSSVAIEKSFFWVNSVPSDPNKVQIELTVEE